MSTPSTSTFLPFCKLLLSLSDKYTSTSELKVTTGEVQLQRSIDPLEHITYALHGALELFCSGDAHGPLRLHETVL